MNDRKAASLSRIEPVAAARPEIRLLGNFNSRLECPSFPLVAAQDLHAFSEPMTLGKHACDDGRASGFEGMPV